MKSKTNCICIAAEIAGAFILGGVTVLLVIRHCLNKKKPCITDQETYEGRGNDNEH